MVKITGNNLKISLYKNKPIKYKIRNYEFTKS